MRNGTEINIEDLASFYGVSPQAAEHAFRPVYFGSESPGLTHPDYEHGDVIELERISYLTTTDPASIGGLPSSTPEQQEEYPLMIKIEHARKCEACARGIIIYAGIRPSREDLERFR